MRKLKILLLEDAEFDAALLLRVLQRADMNFEAVIAKDGKEFLSALEQGTFDIILADNHLPQFDAIMAMAVLKERGLDIPLILVTGTVSEEFAVKMMKEGISDYILKDRMQRLPTAILSAIEKYELEVEKKRNVESLYRSEANLRAIFDNTEVGYILLDTSLGIIAFNASVYKFSVEQLVKPLETGGYFIDFLKPERVPAVKAILEKALNGEHSHYEVSYAQPDGSGKGFNVSCHPVLDKEQKVISIVLSETEIVKK